METFILLCCFQAKHFVADFPLQNRYMLGKFNEGWSFAVPLLAHAGVHTALTFGICLFAAPELWWLCLVDGAAHFMMDRIKAGPRYLGRYNDVTRPTFWWCLGLDQMVHHLTGYAIIYWIVTRGAG